VSHALIGKHRATIPWPILATLKAAGNDARLLKRNGCGAERIRAQKKAASLRSGIHEISYWRAGRGSTNDLAADAAHAVDTYHVDHIPHLLNARNMPHRLLNQLLQIKRWQLTCKKQGATFMFN
jgi:hypothetical protein